MLVAVCGLAREARLFANSEIISLISGGDVALLRARLDATLKADVAGVISIGICGALSPVLRVGDCVIAAEVIAGGERWPADPAWTDRLSARLPQARVASIAGTDAMLIEPGAKHALHQATNAAVADMESHVAAKACFERGIPFAALRVVSDTARRALPPAVLLAMKPDGGVDVGSVLGSVIRAPQQVPALIFTACESEIAFRALLRCRDLLGRSLAGPDLR